MAVSTPACDSSCVRTRAPFTFAAASWWLLAAAVATGLTSWGRCSQQDEPRETSAAGRGLAVYSGTPAESEFIEFDAIGSPAGPSTDDPNQLTGEVYFERRKPTERGVSKASDLVPARRVLLEVRDRQDRVVATTQADDAGRFELVRPPRAHSLTARSAVTSEGTSDGFELAVVMDRRGTASHEWGVELREKGPVRLVIPDEGRPFRPRVAGAFHILDTMLAGALAARRWNRKSKKVPRVVAYWAPGASHKGSHFRPTAQGCLLEIASSSAEQRKHSDSDEHDEAVVLHEFAHCLMHAWSNYRSRGSVHRVDARVDSATAWEEGRATFFAAAALGVPKYEDTLGLEPWGTRSVHLDLETPSADSDISERTVSEQTVARVLWDLADGRDGIPDADHDGVALGASKVLSAMFTKRHESGRHESERHESGHRDSSLSAYLRLLLQNGIVNQTKLARVARVNNLPPNFGSEHGK